MRYTIIMLSIIAITDVGTCLGIDQSICTPGSEIIYHQNGTLKTCTLKDDFAVNGVNCEQYETINLYETGTLKDCVTSDYFNYRDIICNQHDQVSFYPESANLHWAHFRWRDFGRFLLTPGPGGGFNEGDSPVLKNRRAIFPSAESFSPA